MKRSLLSTVLLLAASVANADGPLRPSVPHTGPNATLVRNGVPYRAIGVNYFDCFLRTLARADDTSYDAGFTTLARKGIPFARFCATGFWPSDMKLYTSDRAEYFRRFDGVVKSAESHGIGLVLSLFWSHSCVPDLVGEPMDQWANPNSKTRAWMEEYVREVVTRYRNSPAIWAWELGNEFSLQAALPNAVEHRPPVHPELGTAAARSGHDDLTFDMVRSTCAAFAFAVRKYDPHRLVFTGDSFPRLSAWHQEHEGSWTHDTPDQFTEMLVRANPDPVNGIGLHAYEDDDQRFDSAMTVSRKINKPVFIGEFGAQSESPEQAAKFRRLLQAIIDHDIPLAALWVFDYANQPDFNVAADNARSWQFDAIAEANIKLNASGALKLVSPLDYQVIQRRSKDAGTIPISGTIASPESMTAGIEARLVANGTPGEWRRIERQNREVEFQSQLDSPSGGWFRLEVRATSGGIIVGESTVPHVGVGEIFIIAGQSNSANHGEEKQATKSGLVAAFDGRRWQVANDPQPGASGSAGSFMPPFGDALAEKFHVPVGIVACGVGATSVREWLSKGSTFPNPPTLESHVQRLPGGKWESKGTIFDSFVTRMKALGPKGFRAVLWHQGESDANQKDPTRTLPGDLYRQYLEKVIGESRREIGWDAPWFVAQASYHEPGDESSPEIRAAQAATWKDGIALEGPDTDVIKGPLRENDGRGVHFSGPGLREHAARWMEKIAPWIERQIK